MGGQWTLHCEKMKLSFFPHSVPFWITNVLRKKAGKQWACLHSIHWHVTPYLGIHMFVNALLRTSPWSRWTQGCDVWWCLMSYSGGTWWQIRYAMICHAISPRKACPSMHYLEPPPDAHWHWDMKIVRSANAWWFIVIYIVICFDIWSHMTTYAHIWSHMLTYGHT